MDDSWKEKWECYLITRFEGKEPPTSFIINLGDLNFPIPPLLGIDRDSFNAIKKHNLKKGIF